MDPVNAANFPGFFLTLEEALRRMSSKSAKTSTPSRRTQRPNCTHTTMERTYGNHQCLLCGARPQLGWVYACTQDRTAAETPGSTTAATPSASDLCGKSILRVNLEKAGLSESLILQAEAGCYTEEQITQLRHQKAQVKAQIIAVSIVEGSANESYQYRDVTSSLIAQHGASITGQPAQLPSPPSSPERSTPKKNKRKSSPLSCNFRCCHNCRPYYRDRIYSSFDAVFANEVPPLTHTQLQTLPVQPAEIVANLGLRTTYPNSSDELDASITTDSMSYDTPSNTSSEEEVIRQSIQTAEKMYSLRRSESSGGSGRPGGETPIGEGASGLRTRLKKAFQNAIRPTRESSSDGSSITLPLPGTSKMRDMSEGTDEFDLGSIRRRLRGEKSKKTKYNSANRSGPVEARSSTTWDGLNGTMIEGPYKGEIAVSLTENGTMLPMEHSEPDAVSEAGSEIEVQGGLALTEEAVEMHTPDIITQG
ncbi:hypothetical protein M501DRAFT_992948 [Patellaria atrata CBS 101060]|uniref:Uncharacterized protein n=1 Tax=Patellaria atrata CBS 101060 TaxID=1346257 RepID=A0A9P4S8U8_9PEZI|nr:hypothetical protein M501DRAFT_992948 [Patellaria atrata CBS 101060]